MSELDWLAEQLRALRQDQAKFAEYLEEAKDRYAADSVAFWETVMEDTKADIAKTKALLGVTDECANAALDRWAETMGE